MASAAQRRTSPPSATPRKVFPIKHADGQPLTRLDIQFDFLNAVFADSNSVFTNPYGNGEEASKITFRELYINAILHSPKATKVLKDKMSESQMFAMDFSMLALLVNVGRVNTTMSFFPGMKTAIRTYHPIPALSRTDGNLQDAPRIKHVLKGSLLATDMKSTPATPAEVLGRYKAGKRPTTSVTNLAFVLAHHSGPVGQAHFEGQFSFLDLFLRTDLSSESRAQVFLWLCFNYLESPVALVDMPNEDKNPFSDPAKKGSPPPFVSLTPEEIASENQETEEDNVMREKLLNQRSRVVLSQTVKEAMKESAKASMNGSVAGDDDDDAASVGGGDIKGKKAVSALSGKGKGKHTIPATSKDKKVILTIERSKTRQSAMLIPDLDDDDQIEAFIKQRPASRRRLGSEPFRHPSVLFATLPSQLNRVASDPSSIRHRYSPYARHSPDSTSSLSDTRSPYKRPHLPTRTMFQQAWHMITSTDPLVDSDNESGGDEHVREDYLQRLEVVERFSHQPWSQEQPYAEMEIETEPR